MRALGTVLLVSVVNGLLTSLVTLKWALFLGRIYDLPLNAGLVVALAFAVGAQFGLTWCLIWELRRRA